MRNNPTAISSIPYNSTANYIPISGEDYQLTKKKKK